MPGKQSNKATDGVNDDDTVEDTASPFNLATTTSLKNDIPDDSESSHFDEDSHVSDVMKRKALDFLLKDDSYGESNDDEEDDPYMRAFVS